MFHDEINCSITEKWIGDEYKLVWHWPEANVAFFTQLVSEDEYSSDSCTRTIAETVYYHFLKGQGFMGTEFSPPVVTHLMDKFRKAWEDYHEEETAKPLDPPLKVKQWGDLHESIRAGKRPESESAEILSKEMLKTLQSQGRKINRGKQFEILGTSEEAIEKMDKMREEIAENFRLPKSFNNVTSPKDSAMPLISCAACGRGFYSDGGEFCEQCRENL